VAATAKLFQTTLVETKPAVDKRNYLEQFVSRALAAKANGVYIIEVEIAANQPWPSRDDFVEQLLAAGKHASTVPLVPAGVDPPAKFEDLSSEVRRAYEIYPLVEGETVISINMLCLEKDWEGLQQRVVFIDRETNLSRAYFAAPGLRADPHTPGITPASLLFRIPPAPVLQALTDGPDAAIDAAQREFDLRIFSIVLDTLSTLSWATPAGPFVAAGVAIIQVIVQALFGVQSNLLDEIKQIADDVVERIKYFEETEKITEELNALATFSKYVSDTKSYLNTKSRATFRHHLFAPAGILFQLNDALGAKPPSLLSLKTALLADADLSAADGAPYTSAHRWTVASAKLNMLFLTITFYITALKFLIVLQAELYESGYDLDGNVLDPDNLAPNPDNTFSLLAKEVDDLNKKLPQLIANVRTRRMGMITEGESHNCDVAYSNLWKWKAQRGEWAALFNEHDALFTGDRWDLMVRSREDNPSIAEFGVPDREHPSVWTGQGWIEKAHVDFYKWHRLEIIDKALYNGRDPQQWVLSNCGTASNRYAKNRTRFTELQKKYNDKILREFDNWAKVPDSLKAGVDALAEKWTPTLPQKFPPLEGRLLIPKWEEAADKDELWFDQTVSVKYWFTLLTAIGKESNEQDSKKATESDWIEPKGKRHPRIIGLPTAGEYLKYISHVCLYRQFKKEFRDGPKYGELRRVKLIRRPEGKDSFSGDYIDKASTEFDKRNFSTL
jgi:hypothetical protein